MQALFLFWAAVLTVHGLPSNLSLRHDEFKDFKLAHSKEYSSLDEEHQRLRIFSENLHTIEQHNELYRQGLKTYTMGVNQFADMTQEEFEELLTFQSPSPVRENVTLFDLDDREVPSSFDWRDYGAVTPVKNQGQCGSCWSFSSTGAIEGAIFIKRRQLVSLSEEYLIDCDNYNHGCRGGFMQNAFTFVSRYGIPYETEYPYVGVQGKCKFYAKEGDPKVSGSREVAHNEDALMRAVATVGPISIAIDSNYIRQYNGGIFYEPHCSSTALNHAVLAVGYGTERGRDYWLIKNSWGPNWGEEGYIRIIRNFHNHCGIATFPSFPLL